VGWLEDVCSDLARGFTGINVHATRAKQQTGHKVLLIGKSRHPVKTKLATAEFHSTNPLEQGLGDNFFYVFLFLAMVEGKW
jgi:hypothetical protein